MKNQEILNTVSEILDLDADELLKYSKKLDDIDATYFWNPERGGLSIIINDAGEKLVATSSVNFEKHYEDFCGGRRN